MDSFEAACAGVWIHAEAAGRQPLRAEGAAQSSGPLAAAAVNARSSAELAAGRIGETAETLRGKTVSVDMGRALAPLRTLKAKQGAELDRLRQMAEKARTDADMSALWKQAVARYSAEARPGVEKSITAEAPPGYERESDLALGSPSQRGMALDESFADFIRASGSDRATLNNPDAKNVWKALETINRLSRAGIVILPFRHAIPNLGMAYLAGDATSAVRGDPETMLRILLGRYRADPDVYRRAVEAGATSPFSVGAFAGT